MVEYGRRTFYLPQCYCHILWYFMYVRISVSKFKSRVSCTNLPKFTDNDKNLPTLLKRCWSRFYFTCELFHLWIQDSPSVSWPLFQIHFPFCTSLICANIYALHTYSQEKDALPFFMLLKTRNSLFPSLKTNEDTHPHPFPWHKSPHTQMN